ncbi:MAG: adenosylcobinamide kinase/adenosylcobinamide phosphate guanyltransferase [Dehalococcoidia bacterium]|jgi:adenosylcobinamide kinase/adenosylcobinamide-phosphate guanylyltransferase|nr:MAG: adenosylcobinamide kinase/adenosylcobinamide phosphate guanyltransferase [Dehalococcoidia bacterium]
MPSNITLITGGIRSGKSDFAEQLMPTGNEQVLYIATGTANDNEMDLRIQRHQARRPGHWITLEESLNIVNSLKTELTGENCPKHILLDSLDGWISNVVLTYETLSYIDIEQKVVNEVEQLITICHQSTSAITIVSSEVGLSLVSSNKLGRYFQDLLGIANQRIATAADKVYLIVSGLPVKIKSVNFPE